MSGQDRKFTAFLSELQRAQKDLPKVLAEAVEQATIRAVEAAAEATPPLVERGANTTTGELKQRWATDSKTKPTVKVASGSITLTTELNNNAPYASYVNDGHRLDRHFVPGLTINEKSGLLEYNPDGKGGIVVGTKTSYVMGFFMADKGVKTYEKALEKILDAKIEELFE